MPEATLNAFADHGEVGRPMDADLRDAEETLRRAEAAGIDLPALTAELEREGVRSFCDSYRELLGCIETKASVSARRADRSPDVWSNLSPPGTATSSS